MKQTFRCSFVKSLQISSTLKGLTTLLQLKIQVSKRTELFELYWDLNLVNLSRKCSLMFVSAAISPSLILTSNCARSLGRGCHNVVELLEGVLDKVRDTLPRKNSSYTTRFSEGVE